MYYISTTFQVPPVQLRTSSTFHQILRSKSFKHISHYVMNISCHCPEKTTGNFGSHWLEYLLSTWWLRFLQHFSDEGCHLHLHDSGYPEHLKSSVFSAQVYSSSSQRPYLKVANLPRHMQHVAALAFSERNGRCSSASWSNHASKTSKWDQTRV